MSLEGSISSWIETRLDTQVSALRKVVAIAEPAEFELIGRKNMPAAGILVVAGAKTSDSQDLDGSQLIEIAIGIWVSAKGFTGGPDLSKTNGIYDLRALIHAALKNQIPTGAFSPLRYEQHDIEGIDSAMVTMVMQYITTAII